MLQNSYEDNLMNALAVPFILSKDFIYKENHSGVVNAFYRSALDKIIENDSHYLLVRESDNYYVFYDPEFADINRMKNDPEYLNSLAHTKYHSARDAIYSFQEDIRRDAEELGVLERDEEGNSVWTFYLTPVELGVALDDYDFVQNLFRDFYQVCKEDLEEDEIEM